MSSSPLAASKSKSPRPSPHRIAVSIKRGNPYSVLSLENLQGLRLVLRVRCCAAQTSGRAQPARKQHCPGAWARGHIHLWSGIGVPGTVFCSGVLTFCSCCTLTLCWLRLLWEIVRVEDKAFTLRGFLVENLGRLYRRSLGTQDSCALTTAPPARWSAAFKPAHISSLSKTESFLCLLPHRQLNQWK